MHVPASLLLNHTCSIRVAGGHCVLIYWCHGMSVFNNVIAVCVFVFSMVSRCVCVLGCFVMSVFYSVVWCHGMSVFNNVIAVCVLWCHGVSVFYGVCLLCLFSIRWCHGMSMYVHGLSVFSDVMVCVLWFYDSLWLCFKLSSEWTAYIVVPLPYGHMVAILGILLWYVLVMGDVSMLHDHGNGPCWTIIYWDVFYYFFPFFAGFESA